MKKVNYVLYSVFFVCLVCLAGCSSSSGGDDVAGGESLSLSLPDTLNYAVSEHWSIDNDLLRASVGGMTISIVEGPDFAEQPAINMTGTYNTKNRETTLDASSGMWIDSGGFFEDETYRILGVSVPQGGAVKWVGEDNPTEGAFLIELRPGDLDFPGYMAIRVTVNQDVSDETGEQPGVVIETLFYGQDDISVVDNFRCTWDVFEDLEDDEEAEEYQKIAGFCYGVWQTTFERVGNCFDTIVLLHENGAALAASGSISMPLGDDLPGSGTGSAVCSWTDASGDGEMGPGDDFTLDLEDVWEDDEDDEIDELYTGTFHLYGLISNVDEARGILDSIGGDFVFDNLIIRETFDNSIEEDGVTFNGGFNLHIYE